MITAFHARALRAGACALATAFALLLGAGAAEAALPRDFYAASVNGQQLQVWFNEQMPRGVMHW